MSGPRFELYVKADSTNKSIGDCPFSLRVLMYSQLKVADWSVKVKIIPVDLQNKPAEFVKLTNTGSTPVLVDRETGKVIGDSGEINEYLNTIFPQVNTKNDYKGSALEASNGIFSKLIKFLRNEDASARDELNAALTEELGKLNSYLTSPDHAGKYKYLLGDQLSELDCSIIPKLKNLQVAANYFRGYEIPAEFSALKLYVDNAFANPNFQAVCPADSEFIHGWMCHGVTKS